MDSLKDRFGAMRNAYEKQLLDAIQKGFTLVDGLDDDNLHLLLSKCLELQRMLGEDFMASC